MSSAAVDWTTDFGLAATLGGREAGTSSDDDQNDTPLIRLVDVGESEMVNFRSDDSLFRDAIFARMGDGTADDPYEGMDLVVRRIRRLINGLVPDARFRPVERRIIRDEDDFASPMVLQTVVLPPGADTDALHAEMNAQVVEDLSPRDLARLAVMFVIED